LENPAAVTKLEDDRAHPAPIWIWGLPLAPLTLGGVLAKVEDLIAARKASYLVTANLNYAMLTSREARLSEVNRNATVVLADGMPLVWASRWRGTPLPERVAGSDLIFALSELAARKGYRLFLLGGEPGVAELAAQNLTSRFPGLVVAGTVSPPFRDLDATEMAQLIATVHDARPDLLIAAFGQPRGEIWLSEHHEALGVPVCIQMGASIDFAAGRVRRAPSWCQKTGLEWAYRLYLEPKRLGHRYFQNGLFFMGRVLAEVRTKITGRPAEPIAQARRMPHADRDAKDGSP
jgi:N-acetylglucosaminyldiphosphoundecaprenol N-acetyl-beta-D-mannosaminyltransferase